MGTPPKKGEVIRVPPINGLKGYSGQTRHGIVEWVDGPYVAVRLSYGRRRDRLFKFTLEQLEAERKAFLAHRRESRKRAAG